MTPAVDLRTANGILGLGPASDWLLDANCPIPKVDIRKPGAARPIWRWRGEDLDAFIESRTVQPGQKNPMDTY